MSTDHYCKAHGLRYICPDCATDAHTGGKIASEMTKLKAENERLREALRAYVAKFGNCGDVYANAQAALAATQEDGS